MMGSILNIEPYLYSDKAIELLSSKFDYAESSWAEVLAPTYTNNATAIIVRLGGMVNSEMISKFADLKYIVSATTGLDHIDLEFCKERNIEVVCLRPYQDFLATIPSTAEMAFGLLLSLVRNIPASVNDVVKGNWDRDRFRGRQLAKRTIGIIGLGRTGSKMAHYCSAFNMKVVYFDPFVDQPAYQRANTLEELFIAADIVSLHVHLLPQTAGMINRDVLKHAKPGLVMVNTSRGGVVNEQDVVALMAKGIIGGLATDVVSGELDDVQQNALYRAMLNGYNIIITPHLGGATFDAMHACEEFIAGKLIEKI